MGKAQAEIMTVRAAKPQHANSALLTMTVEELRGMSVADLQTLQQSAMMALSAHAQQLNTPPASAADTSSQQPTQRGCVASPQRWAGLKESAHQL